VAAATVATRTMPLISKAARRLGSTTLTAARRQTVATIATCAATGATKSSHSHHHRGTLKGKIDEGTSSSVPQRQCGSRACAGCHTPHSRASASAPYYFLTMTTGLASNAGLTTATLSSSCSEPMATRRNTGARFVANRATSSSTANSTFEQSPAFSARARTTKLPIASSTVYAPKPVPVFSESLRRKRKLLRRPKNRQTLAVIFTTSTT
jgi:hypothetical protein